MKTAHGYRPRRFVPATLMLMALALLAPVAADARERIVISTSADDAATIPIEVVIRAIYARIGVDAEIKHFPMARSLAQANSGKVVAEVARIDGMSEKYPNLIQIKPTFTSVQIAAFAAQADVEVDGWGSLSPFKVGIIRGHKASELGAADLNPSSVVGFKALFGMLQKGRIDIAVAPRVTGWMQRKALNADNVVLLQPALEHVHLYHYVHKSRQDLVEPLSRAITEMTESGELDELRESTVKTLLGRIDDGLDLCNQDYSCYER